MCFLLPNVVALGSPLAVAKFLKEQQHVWRLRNFKPQDEGMAKRTGPINLAGDLLVDAGQYLALSSYEPALDHLLREMSRLAKAFNTCIPDTFIMSVQLLRAVGAPGLGKSTFVKSAWSLLRPRMEAVKQADMARWLKWQALGMDELEKRLKSWETPFGPLVYNLDMSQAGECVGLASRVEPSTNQL